MAEQSFKITRLKVGLTVFIGLVIFIIFIVLVGSDSYLFTTTYNLYAYVDNTSGLIKGAPVTLGGYKIGEVSDVDFVSDNMNTPIRLQLRILKKYQKSITYSSTAQIKGIGILGDKFLDISIGKPDEQSLSENSTIQFESSLDLNEITNKIEPGIDNLNRIFKNIRIITDSVAEGKGTLGALVSNNTLIAEINTTLHNLNSITNEIKYGKGSLSQLIYDKGLYTNLTGTSQNIKTLLDSLNNGKGAIGKLMTNDSLYYSVNSVFRKINGLFNQINQDSTIVNRLISDKNLYIEIEGTIKNLNTLIVDFREHPERYVKLSVF